jgi:hypothetical protein
MRDATVVHTILGLGSGISDAFRIRRPLHSDLWNGFSGVEVKLRGGLGGIEYYYQ